MLMLRNGFLCGTETTRAGRYQIRWLQHFLLPVLISCKLLIAAWSVTVQEPVRWSCDHLGREWKLVSAGVSE
jgi:hypothetical protein